jgi:hypothetical protein
MRRNSAIAKEKKPTGNDIKSASILAGLKKDEAAQIFEVTRVLSLNNIEC